MGTDMFPEWINPLVSVGIGVFLWRYMARNEKRADERCDRFEARFDERFDRMETRFDERFDRFEARFDECFDKFDERFDRFEAKFDECFDKFDERFDRMEYRIDGLAHEATKNGRALARIEAHYEGRPLAEAE